MKLNNITGRGFTLIELMVVVAIFGFLCALLLPLLAKLHQRSSPAQTSVEETAKRGEPDPSAPPPVIDTFSQTLKLSSTYRSIGLEVFTYFRVDSAGSISCYPSPNSKEMLLMIPFPEGTIEARDIELTFEGAGHEHGEIIYNRRGIFCLFPAHSTAPILARFAYSAFGRGSFVLGLPPARELRNSSIALDFSQVGNHFVPDESLQPTVAEPSELLWKFKNIVTDRKIVVVIEDAQSPLARLFALRNWVAVAVFLFGAGFWFLSEQFRPGQLKAFRLGHFLLLATTYSLFFVIFAVLELHGTFGTIGAMVTAAVLSWPLLVLHTSRILNLRFAVTRILPLAILTLAMVLSGVYAGGLRDYIFVAAAFLAIAYLTLSYHSWTEARANASLKGIKSPA